MNDNPVVLYHAQCADGFTAAWVAHHAMKARNPYFIPVQYDRPPPREAFSGRVVYVLDFSYPADVLEKMISMARSVVVLDHHRTAQADLLPLVKKYSVGHENVIIHFDMNKSGARLAWEHFHQRDPGNVPKLVRWTEDRDLWLWNLPSSREISAWLASFPKTFAVWDEAADVLDNDFEEAADQGAAILRYQERVVDNQVDNAVEVTIGGHRVLCCNCTTLISEVAGKLAVGKPFGATFFVDNEGKRVYSLRSTSEGIDVSAVAKTYGGGGHKHAAGFRTAGDLEAK